MSEILAWRPSGESLSAYTARMRTDVATVSKWFAVIAAEQAFAYQEFDIAWYGSRYDQAAHSPCARLEHAMPNVRRDVQRWLTTLHVRASGSQIQDIARFLGRLPRVTALRLHIIGNQPDEPIMGPRSDENFANIRKLEMVGWPSQRDVQTIFGSLTAVTTLAVKVCWTSSMDAWLQAYVAGTQNLYIPVSALSALVRVFGDARLHALYIFRPRIITYMDARRMVSEFLAVTDGREPMSTVSLLALVDFPITRSEMITWATRFPKVQSLRISAACPPGVAARHHQCALFNTLFEKGSKWSSSMRFITLPKFSSRADLVHLRGPMRAAFPGLIQANLCQIPACVHLRFGGDTVTESRYDCLWHTPCQGHEFDVKELFSINDGYNDILGYVEPCTCAPDGAD